MKFINYAIETNPMLVEKVYQRRQVEMEVLQHLGFDQAYCVEEKLFPFSIIPLFWLGLYAKAMHDVVKVRTPLRLTAYAPFVINIFENTYAHLDGLGCHLDTLFDDGSILMSVNFDAYDAKTHHKYKLRVLKDYSITAMWHEHLYGIKKYEHEGINPVAGLTIEEAIAIQHRTGLVQLGLTDRKKRSI